MHIKPGMENPIKSKTLITKKQWEQKHKDNTVKKKKALVYCEKQFGLVDGKTASALVRHSELYSIVGIIDSSLGGKDAGQALGGEKCGNIHSMCAFTHTFKPG